MSICDGCGARVDDLHIRQRIERLESATRFRPVHISVLFVDAAPPARLEDYFYRATGDHSGRSSTSREFFDGLINCAGVSPAAGRNEEAALLEFQRRGYFLIGVVECALANPQEVDTAIERAAPALLRRVNVSYKPKSIALLSRDTEPLVEPFKQSDWAGRLILHDGKPFDGPAGYELLAKALDAGARA
jgi:hypothetical protein